MHVNGSLKGEPLVLLNSCQYTYDTTSNPSLLYISLN